METQTKPQATLPEREMRNQVLLVEVLAGPIFALGWTAGLTHSKQMAPPGQSSTMIGLFTGPPRTQPHIRLLSFFFNSRVSRDSR